jgi:hypothetical protein
VYAANERPLRLTIDGHRSSSVGIDCADSDDAFVFVEDPLANPTRRAAAQKNLEPEPVETGIDGAIITRVERFTFKPNVFYVTVVYSGYESTVERVLEEFVSLHSTVKDWMKKDPFPKRMLFTGLETQRSELNAWLQVRCSAS